MPRANKTRGEIEAAVSAGVVRIQQELFGRGPRLAKASLSGDRLIVTLQGGLTMVEQSLLACGCGEEASPEASLIRQLRESLFCTSRNRLESIVAEETGTAVSGLQHSLSCQSGDEVIVIGLLQPPALRERA